jgi:UPF0755 protein
VRGCLIRLMIPLVLVIAAIGAGYWYLGPYPERSPETFVDIEHGMSSRQIADALAERGVVRSRWAFLAVRALHPSTPLQAGEYRFGPEQTPWEVFDKIRRGDIFFQYLTVPEGSNMFDIANLLSTELDAIHPDDFLRAASDPQMIRDLDPQAPTLEGYLFPSTYQVTHRTTAKQLCRMMTGEFRKQWALFKGSGQTTDIHKVVTLASLIEKESALPGERPLVSSVFVNRLRLGMPLQCDPTAVYAALRENRYSGVIHRSDLASKDLYNTYTHTGLPPGPITNPGSGALKAALDPAGTGFLYFVAKPDGSGSHHFSATLEEHERAVLAYRKGTR